MTVLVTGGGGFLAAWIIRRLLARGRAVRVFDQAENRRLLHLIVGPAADQVEWLRGDIARAEDVRAAVAALGLPMDAPAMTAAPAPAAPRRPPLEAMHPSEPAPPGRLQLHPALTAAV